MKRRQGWLFFIIFLLTFSIYLLINFPLQLGLDLKGGSQLTLQLVKEDGKVSKEEKLMLPVGQEFCFGLI